MVGWQLKLETQMTSEDSLARQQSRSRGQVHAFPKGPNYKSSQWKRQKHVDSGHMGIPQLPQGKVQIQQNTQGDMVRPICTGCFTAANGRSCGPREEARAVLGHYLTLRVRVRASSLEYQLPRGKLHLMSTMTQSSPEHCKHPQGYLNFNHKT